MKPLVSMRDALKDSTLLGYQLTGDSWLGWRTLLIGMMGERLTEAERDIFKQLTQLDHEPGIRVEEFACAAGRRAGKSRAISVLACYAAALCGYADVLVPGEVGVLLIIAPDQRQATIILSYIAAALEASERLKRLVRTKTSDTITLTNGISIEVRAASFRRLRGPSYIMVVGDEFAFWPSLEDGSTNPDAEIIDAIRPGLSTTHGMLALISSPYAKRGVLWSTFKRYFGPANADRKILVAQGASRTFNPSLSSGVVARALERDPVAARAEWLGQFRDDLSNWISLDLIEAAVDRNITVRPPQPNVRYHSFTDGSGGVHDSFCCAIAHAEGNIAVLDCLIEIRAPLQPDNATAQIADALKSYRCSTTTGDKYSAQWIVNAFAKRGITYRHSDRDRSAIYADALPLFSTGRCKLLDNKRTVSQLAALERKTSTFGRDKIDHGPGGMDDNANVVCGSLVATQVREETIPMVAPVIFYKDGSSSDPHDNRSTTQRALEYYNSSRSSYWGPVGGSFP